MARTTPPGQLSLFDLFASPPRRGRDYALTVEAKVRLRHPAMLHERASAVEPSSDWVAALDCLLDPESAMLPLADALDLVAVDVDLSDRGDDWCALEWTVTATVRDAQALRDRALAACPDKDRGRRAAIRRSVGDAWQWAADPYAPLRAVPGIDWTPVAVTVKPSR